MTANQGRREHGRSACADTSTDTDAGTDACTDASTDTDAGTDADTSTGLNLPTKPSN